MPRSGLAKPALIAVLPAILIALIVAGCSGESPAGNGGARAGDSLSGTESGDSAGDVAAPDAGGPATGGGLPLPSQLDRKIVRTANLELEVEDVSAAVREVEGAAVAAGGFVSGAQGFVGAPPPPGGGGGGGPRGLPRSTPA